MGITQLVVIRNSPALILLSVPLDTIVSMERNSNAHLGPILMRKEPQTFNARTCVIQDTTVSLDHLHLASTSVEMQASTVHEVVLFPRVYIMDFIVKSLAGLREQIVSGVVS